jgi:hypothetical protein
MNIWRDHGKADSTLELAATAAAYASSLAAHEKMRSEYVYGNNLYRKRGMRILW